MIDTDQYITLIVEQANKTAFPPGCPVYLYDESESPPGIDAQGVVTDVLSQKTTTESIDTYDTTATTETSTTNPADNGTCNTLYKVNIKCKGDNGEFFSKKEIVEQSKLRYRNGCNVILKGVKEVSQERTAGSNPTPGGEDEAIEEIPVVLDESTTPGIVLGFCDMPGEKGGFWYTIQEILGKGSEEVIHHKVLAEQVTYRFIDEELGKESNNEDKEWLVGIGKHPGTKIWCVKGESLDLNNENNDNDSKDNDNDDEDINGKNDQSTKSSTIKSLPENTQGEFEIDNTYIILHSTKDNKPSEPESESLLHNIYLWIGSKSTNKDYDAIMAKVNDLDHHLNSEYSSEDTASTTTTSTIQHLTKQFYESDSFLKCFPHKGTRTGTIMYIDNTLNNGIEEETLVKKLNGESNADITIPTRLYHVRRVKKVTKCVQKPVHISSLNDGDTFILDKGSTVYTWFGSECTPFEKSKAAEMAQNIILCRAGFATKLVQEVDSDNDEFWNTLGGKEEGEGQGGRAVKAADEYDEEFVLLDDKDCEPKIFILRTCVNTRWDGKEQAQGKTQVQILHSEKLEECGENEKTMENLKSDCLYLIDVGNTIFVWIGKHLYNNSGLDDVENMNAFQLVKKYKDSFRCVDNANIVRVIESQESIIKGFDAIFKKNIFVE